MGSFFVKSRKCMSLKFTEEFSVMSKKNDAKFLKEFDLPLLNWHDKFDEFWPLHSKVSKICTLTGSFWRKYVILELKRHRGVIFYDTEEWWKIWRKTDLWFGKWHQEFSKFSPQHSKVSKLGLWWDPFIKSRKFRSLKLFTEELCVMTMKNDAKFEEKLTCCFKTDMRSLTNFDPSKV